MWTRLASNPRLPPQRRALSPRQLAPERGVKRCFRASSPPPLSHAGTAGFGPQRSSAAAAAAAAHLRVRTWASGAGRSEVGVPGWLFPGGVPGSRGTGRVSRRRRPRAHEAGEGWPQLSSGCPRSGCTSRWTPSDPGKEGHGAVGTCLLLQTLLAGWPWPGKGRAELS